jgi:hypothetical protein
MRAFPQIFAKADRPRTRRDCEKSRRDPQTGSMAAINLAQRAHN